MLDFLFKWGSICLTQKPPQPRFDEFPQVSCRISLSGNGSHELQGRGIQSIRAGIASKRDQIASKRDHLDGSSVQGDSAAPWENG